MQSLWHVRHRVPQSPQGSLLDWLGAQAPSLALHACHWQSPPQSCVPLLPQALVHARVALGAQAPSPPHEP